jgi:hypothetical protein
LDISCRERIQSHAQKPNDLGHAPLRWNVMVGSTLPFGRRPRFCAALTYR